MSKQKRPAPDDVREPVQDPTEAQGGGLANAIATEETPGPADEGETLLVIRPSQLVEQMAAAGKAGTDHFRFLRENGLPAPTRQIRVSGAGSLKGSAIELPPLDLEAVDESDAIRRYAVRRQVPASELHRFRFQTVILEE